MPIKKILVVDDEPELLKAMRIKLASLGYDVLTATSGKEAIQLVKKEVPDAIILDIMMPEMDGIEALKRIRSFNKRVPVFMLTAYPSEQRMQNTESLGISAFIPKGTEFENASELVRVALKGQNRDKSEMDKKRILVVDDEVELVKALQIRLQHYEVLVAYNGQEALKKVKEEKPDLIILDLTLPKMDGYEVCGLLKADARYNKIPVIILTARAQESDIKLVQEVGAEAYIIKPFEHQVLLAKIEELLQDQGVA